MTLFPWQLIALIALAPLAIVSLAAWTRDTEPYGWEERFND